jgi:hypothetical protein
MLTVGGARAVKLVTSATLVPPPFCEMDVMELVPAVTVTMHEYVPTAVAVVVQSVVPVGPVSVTMLFGVAVPDTVGVRVVSTLRGATMLTVGGATAVNVVTSATLVPPAFCEMAEIEFTPAVTVTTHE